MKKPAVYQSNLPYPSLHVMVTDNDRYFIGRKTYEDIDECVGQIRKWLEAHLKEEG